MFSESVAEKCVQKILFSQNIKIHETYKVNILYNTFHSKKEISSVINW